MPPSFVLFFASALGAAQLSTGVRVPREIPFTPDVKTAPAFGAPEIVESSSPSSTVETPPARSARALAAPSALGSHARDRLDVDVRGDGTVWVRGDTYKAHFESHSIAYIPFLGSRAPRNYPLRVDVESVTVGGVALELDGAARVNVEGRTVAIDRGPFVERYELTPRSIEQTFTFGALPSRGEIVITLALDTELAARADLDGFRFENELGHVRYGRAWSVDANGRRDSLASDLGDGRIEIRVPQDVVARAKLPLVVDPIINTFVVEDGTADEFAADTAFDSTTAAWFTVCEEVFSATDHDVHGTRHTTAGVPTSLRYIDSSAENWRAPRVANNNVDDQWLVVCAVGDAPSREIHARTVGATVNLITSAPFQISTPGAFGDQFAPDVGGDPSSVPPAYYCVIWERTWNAIDHDVHARLVNTGGNLVGAGTILIDNSAGTLDTNPTVSHGNGSPATEQDWTIVWEREVEALNRDIYGARLHWDGVITDATTVLAAGVLDERFPTSTAILDTGPGIRPWLLCYQLDTASDGWDVRTRSFDGMSSIQTFDLSEQFATNNLDQITPVCDTDGRQFIVAYVEHPSPVFTSTDVKVSTIYSLGGALGVNEGNVSVAPGMFTDMRPQLFATSSAGASTDDAMIAFDRNVSGQRDTYATSYDLPLGGPVTSICAGDGSGTACPCANEGDTGHGCGNSIVPAGAILSATGEAALTSDTLVLHASSMPTVAPVLFFQGTSASGALNGTVFGDGLRCASGTVIRLATKTASSGAASYPGVGDLDVSVRGAVPAAGAVRYYQAHYRNSANFCTVSTFNLTNGLRVQWIP